MYAGSKVTVGEVAGTKVEIEQVTDYPWSGKVTLIIRPAEPKKFSIHFRLPERNASRLYTNSPIPLPKRDAVLRTAVPLDEDARTQITFTRLAESEPYVASHENSRFSDGYRVITQKWGAGDRIEFRLPLVPQRIKADERRGRGSRTGRAPHWAADLLHREARTKTSIRCSRPMRR